AFLVDGIASEVAFAAAVIARHRTIVRAFARGPAHREPAGVAARSAIAAAPAKQATFAAEIAAITVAIMLAARPGAVARMVAVALMIAAELPAAAQAALVHPAVALPAPLGVIVAEPGGDLVAGALEKAPVLAARAGAVLVAETPAVVIARAVARPSRAVASRVVTVICHGWSSSR